MTIHRIHRTPCVALSAVVLGFCALTLAASLANAQVVQGFESGLAGVSSIGDVGVVDSTYGDAPTEGTSQALLTTFTGNDGGGISGTDAVAATGAGSVESFLNLAPGGNGLALDPADVGVGGSALSFALNVATQSSLNFDYNFLTNEVPAGSGGNNDFAMLTINDGVSINEYLLATAQGGGLIASNTQNFNLETGYLSLGGLTLDAGSYIVGVTILDDNYTESPSGLLLDNVTLTALVPEPGSLALGALALAAALIAVRGRRVVPGV
jgi:hypothetical protein